MSDSLDERIKKVRTLYERSNIPGERAAAWEALQRLLKSEEQNTINWLEEAKRILIAKGYYMCLAVGDDYLYSRVSEKVWIKRTARDRGSWSYVHAATGKRFIPPEQMPDKSGNSLEQLSKAII